MRRMLGKKKKMEEGSEEEMEGNKIMMNRKCLEERSFRERKEKNELLISIEGEDRVGMIKLNLRKGWKKDWMKIREEDEIGEILLKIKKVEDVKKRIIGRRIGLKNERKEIGRERESIGNDLEKR